MGFAVMNMKQRINVTAFLVPLIALSCILGLLVGVMWLVWLFGQYIVGQ